MIKKKAASRTRLLFSGFFFAKSVSEGGGTSMEYGKFPVAVKRSGGF